MPEEHHRSPPSRRKLFIGIGCLGTACLAVVLFIVLRAKIRDDIQQEMRAFGQMLLFANIGQMLADIDMPQEEAQAAVDAFTAGFEDCEDDEGKEDQFAYAVGAVILAYGVEIKYLPESGLPDPEKVRGLLAAARYARAASTTEMRADSIDGVIGLAAVDVYADDIDAEDANRVLRPTLTDDELRAVLARMKAVADDCGIGDMSPGIDLTAEIERVAERVCGPRPAEDAPDL